MRTGQNCVYRTTIIDMKVVRNDMNKLHGARVKGAHMVQARSSTTLRSSWMGQVSAIIAINGNTVAASDDLVI